MISIIRRHKIECLLALSILIFAVYFSIVAINRFYTFRSNYFDLGIMDQVVYNTSKGRFLEMTNQDLKTNASRFAIHFDPILAVFAPFYWIYESPNVLLVGQIIAIACGAWAVYLISKNILKNRFVSYLFALSYLFYYPNERAVIFDFHGVVMATSFLLFAIYFSLTKRYKWMLLFIVLSLLTKEHIGLITFLFGLYMVFIQKERRYSFMVILISLIFFIGTFFYIIPTARNGAHFALRYFDDLGDTPKDMVISFFTNPMYLIGKLSAQDAREYLASLLGPHAAFMLFAPLEFFISLPELALNVLSKNSNMRAAYFHYNAAIVPFVYFSAITGFKRMQSIITKKSAQALLILLYIGANMYIAYLHAPLPFSFLSDPYTIEPIDKEKLSDIELWRDKLADDRIPVATSPQLGPFFTNRKYYYNFLYDTGFQGAGLTEDDIIKEAGIYTKAEYVILSEAEVNGEGSLEQKFYKELQTNADYKVIYQKGDIIVYKR